MCYKKTLSIFTFALITTAYSHAQQNDTKIQQGDLTLIEAYRQRTMQKKELVAADTHFIIVWQGQDYPRSFVWLANGRALTCSFSKVTTAPPKGKKPQQGLKYYPIKTPANKLVIGDTLDITPLNVIDNTVPIREQQRKTNTLFYTTSSKDIMYTLGVDNIGQGEDVVR